VLEIELQLDGNPLFDGRHYFVWDIENKDTPWDAVPTDRYFFFDVAPDASKVKTYAYPKMYFALLSSVGRPGNKAKAGAQYYAHQMSRLGAGAHKVSFKIRGKETIEGGFTINGGNYAFYNQLADKLEAAGAQNAVIPAPKLRDAGIENSIKAAVRNAGSRDTILRV